MLVNLFLLGLYIAGIIFFYSSRGTEYFVDQLMAEHRKGKLPWIITFLGCCVLILCWPMTQLLYVIQLEFEDLDEDNK